MLSTCSFLKSIKKQLLILVYILFISNINASLRSELELIKNTITVLSQKIGSKASLIFIGQFVAFCCIAKLTYDQSKVDNKVHDDLNKVLDKIKKVVSKGNDIKAQAKSFHLLQQKPVPRLS